MMQDQHPDPHESGRDKQSAILTAALTLIAERGFHGTAMSMIARAAGASAGIIYHYFASKGDLIDALYQKIKRELGQALLIDYAEDAPLRERLRTIWRNTLHYYLHHPRETAFLEQYENSPYYKALPPEAYPEGIQTMIRVVQDGIAAGMIKDLPLEVLYDLTLGVAMATAKRHLRGTIALNVKMIEMVADACWDAVKR